MLDLADPWPPLVRGLLLTAIAVLWTVLLVRIVGLRSFSKMTSFDFVTTIATGSLIAQAGTRDEWMAFLQCLTAIAGVFAVQYALARLRQRWNAMRRILTNRPVLLMEEGKFLEKAMTASRVSRSSVLEKLRAANVTDFSEIRAVVLETTGNISVIHGDALDRRLIEEVDRL